jgi:hypothetical protein
MSSDAGLYAFSLLALFLAYVFVSSIREGLKKKYHWRWGIILLLALYTFIHFGIQTKTFDFMWRKTIEFIQSPPWKSQTGQMTEANSMAFSQKLQGHILQDHKFFL